MRSRRARQTFSAHAAGGIVMDVQHRRSARHGVAAGFRSQCAHAQPTATPTHNIMAQDVYELGSVFKIFSFALAFEDHTMQPGRGLPDRPGLQDRQVHHPRSRTHAGDAGGARHPGAVLQHRHGADRAALRAPRASAQFLDQHGPARRRCRPSCRKRAARSIPRNWGTIETATVGFGQGISVSPLAFVAAAAAVVNGGRRITPTFLKHRRRPARRAADQAGDQRADARPAALCRDQRHRQEGRRARL